MKNLKVYKNFCLLNEKKNLFNYENEDNLENMRKSSTNLYYLFIYYILIYKQKERNWFEI